MFSCPKCNADRSRVLPVDPCPSCGALLAQPESSDAEAKAAKTPAPDAVVDDSKTELSTPKLEEILETDSEEDSESEGESEYDGTFTVAEDLGLDDDFPPNPIAKDAEKSEDSSASAKPVIATAKVPKSTPDKLPISAAPQSATPAPKDAAAPAKTVNASSSNAKDDAKKTALDIPKLEELPTAILPPFSEEQEKGAASAIDSDIAGSGGKAETPFDESVDLDDGVLTKTVADDSIDLSKIDPKSSGPKHPRASSPDVLTRTVADAMAPKKSVKTTQSVPSPFLKIEDPELDPDPPTLTPVPGPQDAIASKRAQAKAIRATITGTPIAAIKPAEASAAKVPAKPKTKPSVLTVKGTAISGQVSTSGSGSAPAVVGTASSGPVSSAVSTASSSPVPPQQAPSAVLPSAKPPQARVATAPPSMVLPRPKMAPTTPAPIAMSGALPTPPASTGPSPFVAPDSWKPGTASKYPGSMADIPAIYALPSSAPVPAPAPDPAPAPAPVPVATPYTPSAPGAAPPVIGPPPQLDNASYPNAALSGAGQSAANPQNPNQVWREAHPSAQRWAQTRTEGAPRTPKPGIIAMGLMLTGIGIYLLFILLPSKAPLTAAGKLAMATQAGLDENAWRFSEKLMLPANLNAGLFIFLGVVIVLRGALFRQPHSAKAKKKSKQTSMMLGFCFVLFALSFAALLLTASMR